MCSCCACPFDEHAVHHVLCSPRNNSHGGRYDTHDALAREVLRLCKSVGLRGTLRCAGLLGDDPARGRFHDHRADLLVRGLRPDVAGVLGDVAVVHPVSGAGRPRPAGAATAEGATVAAKEREKITNYGDLPAQHSYGFEPLCVETFGRFGERFLAFLTEVSRYAVRHSDAMDNLVQGGQGEDESVEAYAGRLRDRWLCVLSLVRVRSLALRLRGAVVDSAGRPGDRAALGAALFG